MTTTDLRRKTKELVRALENQERVTLVHRSRVIGHFEPKIEEKPAIKSVDELEKAIARMKPKKLVPRNKRDEVYRKNLEEKYGPIISGR